MKKILLLIILLLTLNTYAADIENKYSSLKLSKKQQAKIEQIEIEYNKKTVEINSLILLKNMQIAQRSSSDMALLYKEIKTLENSLEELKQDKEKEILSCLNFFQRFKYKRQCQRG